MIKVKLFGLAGVILLLQLKMASAIKHLQHRFCL